MKYTFARRLKILKMIFGVVTLIFTVRLFQLQVLDYQVYADKATRQHLNRTVLESRRGQILVHKNRLSNELTPLATNNTLKMLYVDPLVLRHPNYHPSLKPETLEMGDPYKAAELLAPLLIHAHCSAIEGCEIVTNPDEWTPETRDRILLYQQELAALFTQTEVERRVIALDLAPSRVADIQELGLSGIYIEDTVVVANPQQIADKKLTAEKLAPIIGSDASEIAYWLRAGQIRYKEITDKIVPEVSERIEILQQDPEYRDILRGVVMVDEHWRYYPEKTLAGQILGFVNKDGVGRYGLEERFDTELRGKEGFILGATNLAGQHLLGNKSQTAGVTQAVDGSDIVISIDRVMQERVEKILEQDRKKYDADSAQAIVMEPKTGRILAMANVPTFDPNRFGDSFLTYPISVEQENADREDKLFNQAIPTILDEGQYYRYANTWGPQVFKNRSIVDIYEPGSVMKAITIAAGLNADEITPETTFNDHQVVEVDEFKIRNANDIYYGNNTSMVDVLKYSINTGIAFITRKMGRQVLYEYLRNFGFAQYTDIKLNGENPGKLEIWHDWSESELITRGYGQGIASTPLQMVTAFAVLANGGYLMKPILVEEVRKSDGRVEKYEPEIIRRVISNEVYLMMKAMLAESVARGYADQAQVDGYTIMGKTGTSSTYGAGGRAREGVGTTIATFAGFAPFDNPEFVLLVKYDYPKTTQWGSETAAPTFSRIAEFLLQYMDIPPDR